MDGSTFLQAGSGPMGGRPIPPTRPQAGSAMLASLGFAALSSIPLATVLVGRHGVAFVNESGETLLARADGLLLNGPYGLSAASRHEARQLQAALESALSDGKGGPVPITRQRAPLPLLVSVSPLRDKLFGNPASRHGFALVLIHDPLAGCAALGRQALVDQYGLTEAEACVAVAIVSGRNAKRIALLRDVSVPTVRSQIRQILAKTACADQREFMSRFGWLGVAM